MKKILLAAAFGGALVAGPASAQWYAGAGLGFANTDSSQISVKILGGYQATRNWGIEAGVIDWGDYHDSSARSASLAGTATLPLDAHWSVMAKLGVAANRPGLAGSSDRTGAMWGVGVGYSLSKNLGVRIEYEQYGKLSDTVPPGFSNDSADNLAFIVKYSF